MRQTSTALLITGFALAALAVASLPAAAKSRHHGHHRHNAVGYYPHPSVREQDQSWLHPGTVAPVGASGPAYVVQSTLFNQTPDESYFPSGFHADMMPQTRPLYVPGTMVPVIRFWTPGG